MKRADLPIRLRRDNTHRAPRPSKSALMLTGLAAITLASCGGSEKSPVDTPPPVTNSGGAPGQKLAFAYFQRCINPILLASLQYVQNGVTTTSTCAAGGCHDEASGKGVAFRVVPAALPVDVTNAANTTSVIRASDMYKNFYSAQGQAIAAAPDRSGIYSKPLLLNTEHAGGRNLLDELDINARRIKYWINNPAPAGQDEFSPATYAMFTPADPNAGACNTQ